MKPQGADTRSRALALLLAASLFAAVDPASAKRKKPASEAPQTAVETYGAAMREILSGDYHQALALLQAIQYVGDERPALEPLVRLAIADATFYQGYSTSHIDARSLYTDFGTLYSDHPGAPYALFQSGMCSMSEMRHPSKDQLDTQRTIADLGEVGRRFPTSPWAQAASKMVRIAENRLAEHEFLIGRFYVGRKRPLAAIARFRTVLDSYPQYPEREKVYLYLGRALLASHNEVEARIYLDKLVKDFPDGRYTDEARRELARAGGQLELGVSGSP